MYIYIYAYMYIRAPPRRGVCQALAIVSGSCRGGALIRGYRNGPHIDISIDIDTDKDIDIDIDIDIDR